MKNTKWLSTALTLVAAALLSGWMLHHNRYQLYEAAIAYEQGQANLVEKRVRVAPWDIGYLESPRQEGAETLLLIHGFGASKENWLRFAAPLTARYHVIALDLPGHGESSQNLEQDYSHRQQVENLRAFTKALRIERFHIVGNSMGGAIASLYAAIYPDELRSVILFDPAGVHDHTSEFQNELAQGRNPLIVEKTADFQRLLEFAMKVPLWVPWPVSEVAAERAIANGKMNHKIFADLNRLDYLAFKNWLMHIQAPTLIIWGSEDRVIHVRNGDLFAELIPNSKLEIFEGVGHLPMIEVPERSAEVVRAFLKAN